MITKEQFEEAKRQKVAAEKTINLYFTQKITDCEARWEQFLAGKLPFQDMELLYSAGARCVKCRAGLAYPDKNQMGLNGAWDCSDILTGRAGLTWSEGLKEGHDHLPFAFYEVKSEDQPSAYGATTRPKL